MKYSIKTGDWLSKIAFRYYKDAMKYDVLYEANKEVIKNPDLIYPGQKIKIPSLDEAKDNIYANIDLEICHRHYKYNHQENADTCLMNKSHFLFFTKIISVPSFSNSYLTSSIKEERIKIPLPLSFNRFSGASGSLTLSGLKPLPSSFIRTINFVFLS